MKSINKILMALVMILALSAAPLLAQDSPAKGLVLPGDVTLAQAQTAVDAAVKKALEQGTLMNIAVVDAGGNLKAFCRMDGAFLGSIDISIKKAVSARYLNMSTYDLGEAAKPGAELYGIEVTNAGMIIFGGGELLKDKGGTIIGAIGVSGSSVANDMAVAQAGAAAILK
jgi:uncharacterized protein GlcG (DUF336 family)